MKITDQNIQNLRTKIVEAATAVFCDYLPQTHIRAMDPNVGLVVGPEGVGKSALCARIQYTATVRVAHSTDLVWDSQAHQLQPRSVWKAVVARHTGVGGAFADLPGLVEQARWMQCNPEPFAAAFEAADKKLADNGQMQLVLFDADRGLPAKDTRELLRVALDLRSSRAIRCKIFIHPDVLENHEITSFVDSSKLLATRVHLGWTRTDLYAMWYRRLKLNVVANGEAQEAMLSARIVRGGRDRLYSLVPRRLQEGLGYLTPRSFLDVMGRAAAMTPDDHPLPLCDKALRDAVQHVVAAAAAPKPAAPELTAVSTPTDEVEPCADVPTP